MSPRQVELSESESIVFQLITIHKCISSTEMSAWTAGDKRWGSILKRPLSEEEIESTIPHLLKHHLICVSPGGSCPKRYCLPQTSSVKQEQNVNDPDLNYLHEAELEAQGIEILVEA